MRTPHALRRTIGVTAFVLVLTAGHAAAHHDDDSGRQPVRDNNTQDYDHNNLTEGGAMACDHGAAQLGRSEISVELGADDIHCHDSFDWGDTEERPDAQAPIGGTIAATTTESGSTLPASTQHRTPFWSATTGRGSAVTSSATPAAYPMCPVAVACGQVSTPVCTTPKS